MKIIRLYLFKKREKVSSKVEFGNTLLIADQEDDVLPDESQL